jgi:hypothetical protein
MTSLASMLPVRFANWPKAWLAALMLVFVGLTSVSVTLPDSHFATYAKSKEDYSDVQLYRDIAGRVSRGENYYNAAAVQQRLHRYPLRPFITVRPPALAMITVVLGESVYAKIIGLIGLLAAALMGYRIYEQTRSPWFAALCALPICAATIVLGFTKLTMLHECGAAMLLCLAITLRTPERYIGAALAALVASLIRETAIAVPLMMLVFAAFEKKFREATVWAAVIAAFAFYIGWHAHMVSAVVIPTDLTSPGWGASLGWSYAVQAVREHSVLALLPPSVAALILPVALFGWLFWKSPLALRGFGAVAGYTLMVALFARDNTPYWAIMATPLLLTGVALALPILVNLITQLVQPAVPQRESLA